MSAEKYLRPEVIRQVARLDLRAKFIIEGFLTGLHSSPFQGFSVEFSEHRKYNPGDDLKYLDWSVYAKTGKYFVKKFQAETNMTGYLVMDLSKSMDWNGPAEARKAKVKLDWSALGGGRRDAHQVRLRRLPRRRTRLPDDPPAGPGRPRRVRHEAHHGHPAQEQAVATRHDPLGAREPEADRRRRTSPDSLFQLASMIKGKSLIMLFSDLLPTPTTGRPKPTR